MNKTQNPLLHVELLPNGQMNFKINGDPVTVTEMIATAMSNKKEIAAAMIASVMAWAEANDIPKDQLHKMVVFHK